MLFEKTLNRIKENKRLRNSGVYLNVPYPYKRLNDYLCGIDRGQAIGVLSATGGGKSRFCRYTFVYNVYKFYKETGYNCRIIFFCMEDGKEQTFNYVLCNYLNEVCNIKINVKELTSKSRELPDFVLEKLEEAKEYFNEFEKIVTFIDGETEPTKVYNICKKIALNLGVVNSWIEDVEGEKIKQYGYESDVHVIAVFDNMSNIDTEDGTSNEQQAILKFVQEYMRLKLCNFFKWTCVIVMQLDFESERQSFNRNGESITSKIEPSLASIGDSKRASRSLHLVFSLFSPHRYDLIRYPIPPKNNPQACYDIEILGNRFRSLKVIKSNTTDTGMRVGLLFDAVAETFEELPTPDDQEIISIYKKFSNKPSSQKIISFEDENEIPF